MGVLIEGYNSRSSDGEHRRPACAGREDRLVSGFIQDREGLSCLGSGDVRVVGYNAIPDKIMGVFDFQIIDLLGRKMFDGGDFFPPVYRSNHRARSQFVDLHPLLFLDNGDCL